MLNDEYFYTNTVSKMKANNTWNPTDIDPSDDENGDNIMVPDVKTNHEMEDYKSTDDNDV